MESVTAGWRRSARGLLRTDWCSSSFRFSTKEGVDGRCGQFLGAALGLGIKRRKRRGQSVGICSGVVERGRGLLQSTALCGRQALSGQTITQVGRQAGRQVGGWVGVLVRVGASAPAETKKMGPTKKGDGDPPCRSVTARLKMSKYAMEQ